MDIILSENIGKYEIEAILKIFFPTEKFNFLVNVLPKSEQNIRISIINQIVISAYINGEAFSRESDVPSAPEEMKLHICKELYLLLNEITGIASDWGLLTGIRPVKKITTMMANGVSETDIERKLRERYLITENKYRLSNLTAQNQIKYLPNIDKSSFSLYICIPFCPSRCSYCSFVSHSIENRSAIKLMDAYVEKLIEEIKYTARVTSDLGLYPTTIYIGGGTPTTLKPQQISQIMENIEKSFNISGVFEYTVEAGRADTISEEKLRVICDNGCTRISINPQTLSDEVLRVIGRNHTVKQFTESFELARKLGFTNINTDLIAGLPSDNVGSFMNSVDGIITLNPESITVHTLTLKRAASLFSETELYNRSEEVKSMTEYSFHKCTENGYLPYYLYRQKNTVGNQENVGYAKTGYESRYNIYIMEEVQSIIACGAGASTKIVNTENGKISRIFNYKYPYEYVDKFKEVINRKQKLYEYY